MKKIFLVDDHQMVREGLRAVLQSTGHAVVGESDVTDGLVAKLLAVHAEVLLLDLNLKNASGLSVLKSLKEGCPHVRTVVLSMSAQPSHISQALRNGALGYVLKGSPSSELLHAIATVCAGQQFLGDQVRQSQMAPGSADLQRSPVDQFSVREIQILKMVVQGKTSASIASMLALSPKTVETYRSRMMTKLKLGDIPALVRFAIQWDLMDLSAPDSQSESAH
jgi:DNA-binding NarL/FixJ family response regulator